MCAERVGFELPLGCLLTDSKCLRAYIFNDPMARRKTSSFYMIIEVEMNRHVTINIKK